MWKLHDGHVYGNPLIMHTKAVTALAIFDPDFARLKDAKNNEDGKCSSPVLISGSLDKTIITWDLFEMKLIRKLPIEKERNQQEEGHTKRINCVAAFDSSPDQICPRIGTINVLFNTFRIPQIYIFIILLMINPYVLFYI